MRMKLAALLLACLPAGSAALERVADTHLHYKWSQQGVTTAADVLDILEAQNIVMGVVIGTPAELALQLAQLAPHRIVPLFSPYQSGGDWHNWAFDDSVVTRARTALATGLYHGIGELHLVGGFAPRLDKARVLPDLLKLAGEYDVPIMLHTEFSRPDLLLELCTQFPETRILWAHAGAIQAPVDVARVLSACDNVSADLAARDPWRFVNNPVADARGRLLPEWRALFIEYQDRLLLGSDPVWPVDQLDRWDEPDTGWQELGRFWGFHRGWLQQLPAAAARKIGCENTVALFRRGGQVQCDPVAQDVR
jgi:hypothetical protein